MKTLVPFSPKLILFCFICSHLKLFSIAPSGLETNTDREMPVKALILKPADSTINGLPLLNLLSPDDSVAIVVYQLFEDSYMRDAVAMYFRAQNYLINKLELEVSEPAYLLLSQNQGGFPKFGFYLQIEDSIIDKSEVPYIELVKNSTRDEDHLGSMTQIYPHEMGHIIYHMLCKETDTIIPATTDIHYSTLATDYQTAFNEGFAMHFENMARVYDPSSLRKEKIQKDFESKKKNTALKVRAYTRDFTWPFRLGFYRISMLSWYQNFEDIKRYEWVSNYKTKFQNKTLSFRDPEKSIQYRNSGIAIDTLLRIPQRSFATEGVVASFFTGLMHSEAKNFFQDFSFYSNFKHKNEQEYLSRTSGITPLENQYMKIFHVLYHHVNFTLSVKSQFLDFIEAYIQEFPEEKELVHDLFYTSTGYRLPMDPGNQLWLTNKTFTHGILVMEQFGGISLPFYTFNLNACTAADLQTFPTIKDEESKKIVNFIRHSGPISNIESLSKVPGIRPETIALLQAHKFSPDDFKILEEEGFDLSIRDLIFETLKQIFIMGGAYFLLSLSISSLILYWRKEKKILKKMLSFLLRFILFYCIAFAVLVLTSNPGLYMAVVSVVLVIITSFLLRSRQRKLLFIYTSLPMILVLIYALI